MSDNLQIEELRDDIDQTRESMSGTISQLEERLAPERLQQDTSDIVREVADKIIAEIQGKSGDFTQGIADQIHAAIHGAALAKSDELFTQASSSIRSMGTSLWDRVGSSPAPVALAAVGIGLLAAGSAGSSSQASAGSSSGAMGAVDGLLAKANSFAERATGAASDASNASGDLLDQAKGFIADSEEGPGQLKDLMSDQPLVVGLVALGLGVAMGLSMPGTEKERDATSTLRTNVQDRLDGMGLSTDASGLMDQAKDQIGSLTTAVKDAATSGLAQAKTAAGDVAATAKTTAAEAASNRGLTN